MDQVGKHSANALSRENKGTVRLADTLVIQNATLTLYWLSHSSSARLLSSWTLFLTNFSIVGTKDQLK